MTIRMSETETAQKGESAGDAITVMGSSSLWFDHNHFEQTLIQVDDKLIVVKLGSTGVTISNNFFQNQNKVQCLNESQLKIADKLSGKQTGARASPHPTISSRSRTR